MLPYQKRVVQEKLELDEKLCKLAVYLKGNPNIGEEDLALLREQETAMWDYSDVLQARISRFAPNL